MSNLFESSFEQKGQSKRIHSNKTPLDPNVETPFSNEKMTAGEGKIQLKNMLQDFLEDKEALARISRPNEAYEEFFRSQHSEEGLKRNLNLIHEPTLLVTRPNRENDQFEEEKKQASEPAHESCRLWLNDISEENHLYPQTIEFLDEISSVYRAPFKDF